MKTTTKSTIEDISCLFLMVLFIYFCLSFELESFLGTVNKGTEELQINTNERGYQTWD